METFGNRLLIFCVFALLLCARASIGGPRHFVRRSLTKVVSVRGGAAGLSYVTEEDEPPTSPKVVLLASTNAGSTLGLHGRFSLMGEWCIPLDTTCCTGMFNHLLMENNVFP